MTRSANAAAAASTSASVAGPGSDVPPVGPQRERRDQPRGQRQRLVARRRRVHHLASGQRARVGRRRRAAPPRPPSTRPPRRAPRPAGRRAPRRPAPPTAAPPASTDVVAVDESHAGDRPPRCAGSASRRRRRPRPRPDRAARAAVRRAAPRAPRDRRRACRRRSGQDHLGVESRRAQPPRPATGAAAPAPRRRGGPPPRPGRAAAATSARVAAALNRHAAGAGHDRRLVGDGEHRGEADTEPADAARLVPLPRGPQRGQSLHAGGVERARRCWRRGARRPRSAPAAAGRAPRPSARRPRRSGRARRAAGRGSHRGRGPPRRWRPPGTGPATRPKRRARRRGWVAVPKGSLPPSVIVATLMGRSRATRSRERGSTWRGAGIPRPATYNHAVNQH